ncbi:MAG TPA: DUF2950 domain-containing protein [Candidatus Binatia bacterium]|nr:DUF2950 domain-containing protein [Candidatus Binatia bacterium]
MEPSRNIGNSSAFLDPVSGRTSGWACLLTLLCLILNALCQAQQGNQKVFASPGDAALALYGAVKADNKASLSSIFGNASDELLHSGDDVADRNTIQNFLRRYDRMHRLVIEPDGNATLYIGAENWPFPIPIAKNSSGTWYFDVAGGRQEILYRRVGRNENDAIEICQVLVEAQREYASAVRARESGKHYATKFISDEGRENGLYWKSSEGEPQSPIGPLLVQAASEGYNPQQGQRAPFHGYYFRILTQQGPSAKGGALDYLANGQLVRGFGILAYPAQYKNSGVMTFVVNRDGIVYQKDLGPETESIASAMTEYNPDDSWDLADE